MENTIGVEDTTGAEDSTGVEYTAGVEDATGVEYTAEVEDATGVEYDAGADWLDDNGTDEGVPTAEELEDVKPAADERLEATSLVGVERGDVGT